MLYFTQNLLIWEFRPYVIRYEANHEFIKDLIRKLKNFDDVAFLLASQNQLHILKSLLMINLSLSYNYVKKDSPFFIWNRKP